MPARADGGPRSFQRGRLSRAQKAKLLADSKVPPEAPAGTAAGVPTPAAPAAPATSPLPVVPASRGAGGERLPSPGPLSKPRLMPRIGRSLLGGGGGGVAAAAAAAAGGGLSPDSVVLEEAGAGAAGGPDEDTPWALTLKELLVPAGRPVPAPLPSQTRFQPRRAATSEAGLADQRLAAQGSARG